MNSGAKMKDPLSLINPINVVRPAPPQPVEGHIEREEHRGPALPVEVLNSPGALESPSQEHVRRGAPPQAGGQEALGSPVRRPGRAVEMDSRLAPHDPDVLRAAAPYRTERA